MEQHSERAKGILNKNENFENDKYFKSLENMATKLIRSKDVESCRKIEYSFYENERGYRTNYKIGKSTYSTDFQENDIEYNPWNNDEVDLTKDFNQFINLHKATKDDVKRTIQNILPFRMDKEIDPIIASKIKDLYDFMLFELGNSHREDLVTVFKGLSLGKSDSDIAKDLGVNRSTIGRRKQQIFEIFENH